MIYCFYMHNIDDWIVLGFQYKDLRVIWRQVLCFTYFHELNMSLNVHCGRVVTVCDGRMQWPAMVSDFACYRIIQSKTGQCQVSITPTNYIWTSL